MAKSRTGSDRKRPGADPGIPQHEGSVPVDVVGRPMEHGAGRPEGPTDHPGSPRPAPYERSAGPRREPWQPEGVRPDERTPGHPFDPESLRSRLYELEEQLEAVAKTAAQAQGHAG